MLTFHLKGWYFYFLCLIAKLLACLCLCNRINKIHGWSSNGLPQRQCLNAMSFWKPLLVLKKGQHHKMQHTCLLSITVPVFSKTKSYRVKFNSEQTKQAVKTPDQATPKHTLRNKTRMLGGRGWNEMRLNRRAHCRHDITLIHYYIKRKSNEERGSQKDHTLLQMKHKMEKSH